MISFYKISVPTRINVQAAAFNPSISGLRNKRYVAGDVQTILREADAMFNKNGTLREVLPRYRTVFLHYQSALQKGDEEAQKILLPITENLFQLANLLQRLYGQSKRTFYLERAAEILDFLNEFSDFFEREVAGSLNSRSTEINQLIGRVVPKKTMEVNTPPKAARPAKPKKMPESRRTSAKKNIVESRVAETRLEREVKRNVRSEISLRAALEDETIDADNFDLELSSHRGLLAYGKLDKLIEGDPENRDKWIDIYRRKLGPFLCALYTILREGSELGIAYSHAISRGTLQGRINSQILIRHFLEEVITPPFVMDEKDGVIDERFLVKEARKKFLESHAVASFVELFRKNGYNAIVEKIYRNSILNALRDVYTWAFDIKRPFNSRINPQDVLEKMTHLPEYSIPVSEEFMEKVEEALKRLGEALPKDCANYIDIVRRFFGLSPYKRVATAEEIAEIYEVTPFVILEMVVKRMVLLRDEFSELRDDEQLCSQLYLFVPRKSHFVKSLKSDYLVLIPDPVQKKILLQRIEEAVLSLESGLERDVIKMVFGLNGNPPFSRRQIFLTLKKDERTIDRAINRVFRSDDFAAVIADPLLFREVKTFLPVELVSMESREKVKVRPIKLRARAT